MERGSREGMSGRWGMDGEGGMRLKWEVERWNAWMRARGVGQPN